MTTKKNFLIAIGVVLFLLIVLLVIKPQGPAIELNKEKIECYENALYFLSSDANITSDKLNIQNVRCSEENYYGQLEITGFYFEDNDHSKEPKPFYFHEIRGGTSASGSDSSYEICLIIDNKKIISAIESGSDMTYKSPARCSWQSKLP